MEFVLLHKQLGPLPAETLRKAVDFAKKITTKTSEVVPGGRLIAAYNACSQHLQLYIWEAPSLDALMPLLEGLRNLGFNTEIIPVEKFEEAILKWEKVLASP